MNHQEATKHAQPFFKSYPTTPAFHVTTDGQVFAEKHHADSHAGSLAKKGNTEPVVHTVEKDAKIEVPKAEGEKLKAEAPKAEKTQEEKDKEAADKKAASIAKGAATKAKNAAAKA